MPALDLEKRRIIQEGFEADRPVPEIAKALGMSPNAVWKTAERMEIQHPSSIRAEDDAQDRVSAQYTSWQRARKGAAATLKSISGGAA
jgi:transposase-like protein